MCVSRHDCGLRALAARVRESSFRHEQAFASAARPGLEFVVVVKDRCRRLRRTPQAARSRPVECVGRFCRSSVTRRPARAQPALRRRFGRRLLRRDRFFGRPGGFRRLGGHDLSLRRPSGRGLRRRFGGRRLQLRFRCGRGFRFGRPCGLRRRGFRRHGQGRLRRKGDRRFRCEGQGRFRRPC